MPAPASGKYTRVDKANFLVEYAPESDTVPGAPGVYAEAGCIIGDPQITDNWDESDDAGEVNRCELTDVDNNAFKDATLGRRNGSFAYDVDMVLDSAVQLQLEADYLAKKEGFLKVTATNVDGNVTKVIYDVRVKTPQFVHSQRASGKSRHSIRHRFVESKPSGGWPTA